MDSRAGAFELKILTLSLYNKITNRRKKSRKNMIAWKLDAPLEAAPTSALHSLCRTSKQAELDIAVIKKGEIECNGSVYTRLGLDSSY